MKKLLLLLTLTVGTLVSKAQLKSVTPIIVKGMAKRGPYKVAAIYQSDSTSYSLTYWDKSYTAIEVYNDIKFKGNDEMIETLYQMFKNQIDAEKGTENVFQLGSQVLKLKTGKFFGAKIIDVWVEEPLHVGHFELTTQEINKLFNK